MPLESPNSFEGQPNPERKDAEQELTLVEREALADAWFAMVMESGDRPLEVSEWDNNKIREWLNETLRQDTEKLVNDWHLAPSAELVEKIQNSPDAEHRSKLEMNYLTDMMAKLRPLGRGNNRSGAWDSYPKIMRQSESMNCVAKSLLAKNLLDRAGVKSDMANPAMHAMNVAELANGEHYFVDTTSGQLARIQPLSRDIDGVTVLEIDVPGVEYRLLPLLNDDELSKPIVGNFRALHDEVVSPEGFKTQAGWGASERTEAQEFFTIFRTEFAATDWDSIWDKLYTRYATFEKSPGWKSEKQRVGDFQEAFDSIMLDIEGHLGQMTDPEAVRHMRKELGDNLDGIRTYLVNDDRAVLGLLGPVGTSLVESLYGKLSVLSREKPEVAREVTDYLFSNWKRFKE